MYITWMAGSYDTPGSKKLCKAILARPIWFPSSLRAKLAGELLNNPKDLKKLFAIMK
jgi:hypothetical protein